MSTAGQPRSLTFNWQVSRVPLILLVFVLISAFGHFCAFFLFQVVYPPQASLKPPHPSFTVLDPRRPDHQALLRWIDAEDPAPAATGAASITDRLLSVQYRPSFAMMRTAPLGVPEPPPSVLFPPARDPLAIIRSVDPKPPPPEPPSPGLPTRVVFSSELTDRVPDVASQFTVSTRVPKAVDSPEFLIGVSDRGEIRFIFQQRASGDPEEAAALDLEAADRLMRVQFKPGAAELTWGHARIDWGAEIYRAPADANDSSSGRHP